MGEKTSMFLPSSPHPPLPAAVGGQTVEAPFGLLWMVDAKYYGTGKHFLVKAVTLDRAFRGLRSLIREMEPPREILH